MCVEFVQTVSIHFPHRTMVELETIPKASLYLKWPEVVVQVIKEKRCCRNGKKLLFKV